MSVQHISHINIMNGDDTVAVLVVDMDIPEGKTLNVSWTNSTLTEDQLKRLSDELDGMGSE